MAEFGPKCISVHDQIQKGVRSFFFRIVKCFFSGIQSTSLSTILDDLKIFKFRFLHYLAESVLVKFLRQEFDSNFLFCMSSAIFSNLASFKCAQ